MKPTLLDDKQLAEIYERQADTLYDEAYAALGSKDFAEAALKNTFEMLCDKGPSFSEPEAERRWLQKALDKSVRRYRKYRMMPQESVQPVFDKEAMLVEILKNNRKIHRLAADNRNFIRPWMKWGLIAVGVLLLVAASIKVVSKLSGKGEQNSAAEMTSLSYDDKMDLMRDIWERHLEAEEDPETENAAIFAKITDLRGNSSWDYIEVSVKDMTEDEKAVLDEIYGEGFLKYIDVSD